MNNLGKNHIGSTILDDYTAAIDSATHWIDLLGISFAPRLFDARDCHHCSARPSRATWVHVYLANASLTRRGGSRDLLLPRGLWYRYSSWYECFLKWWYPTTMGFPTINDHFGVFWGVSPFKETSIWIHAMCMNTIYEYVIACNRNTTWLSKISMEYMQRCERKQIRGYIHLSIV